MHLNPVDYNKFNIKQGQEVNPVEIWEGIDIREETGHNRLTRLAIHILSTVANSASCERVFSHMGLVHTGIHSKLGVEKVCKTTMVEMDIKRMNHEAGLLYTRGKQKFTTEARAQEPDNDGSTLTIDHFDIGDQDDNLLNFDQLSERLIMGAVSANADKDVGNDLDENELPQAPAVTVQALSGRPSTIPMITIPPLDSATLSPHATQAKKTCIPLEILFDYPVNIDMALEGMNLFWRGGIKNLEKEMEAYNILNKSTEENLMVSAAIPTMLANPNVI